MTLALASQAHADGFLHADHKRIVDGADRPVILRGMGLGGWMLQEGYMLDAPQFVGQHVIRSHVEDLIGADQTEAFYRAWRANEVTKADIDTMAGWGFNSVRLPMHYNLFMDDKGGWRGDGFTMVDHLVGWARANDMYVILDLHAAPGGEGHDYSIADGDPTKPSLWDDPGNQDKTVALWRELARRYHDEPHIGAYDILNEPNWGFQDAGDRNGCKETGNAPLRALYQRIIAAIREVDQNHLIIIEGNCWGNNYQGILPIADNNLALSFHKYWNNGTPDTIAPYLALRDQYDLPLWLGESGENSNAWFAANIRLVEDNGIGWSWWPLKKFGFNNPLQIQPNAGMAKVTAYWKGTGLRPSKTEAETALTRLATHDIRFENNIFHKDVVDALFRSPWSDAAVPYAEHVITATGGTLSAVDYDMGRDGAAYHDTDSADYHVSTGKRSSWNDGRTYRNDGVDIAIEHGKPIVSQMQPGEWLHYTLTARRTGRYDLMLAAKGGVLSISLNNAAFRAGYRQQGQGPAPRCGPQCAGRQGGQRRGRPDLVRFQEGALNSRQKAPLSPAGLPLRYVSFAVRRRKTLAWEHRSAAYFNT